MHGARTVHRALTLCTRRPCSARSKFALVHFVLSETSVPSVPKVPSCVNLYQSVSSVQLTKKIVRRLINPKSISVHQVPSLIAGTRLVHRWQATTLYAESADPARKNLDHQCHGHTNIREKDKWDKECFTKKNNH